MPGQTLEEFLGEKGYAFEKIPITPETQQRYDYLRKQAIETSRVTRRKTALSEIEGQDIYIETPNTAGYKHS